MQLLLRVNSQDKPLPTLPLNYEELLKTVNKETGIFNFHVRVGDAEITSSRDLIVTYLNNKEDKLTFVVEEITHELAAMNPASQMMYQSMMDKFKQLTAEEAKEEEPLPVQDGILSKEDLHRVIESMTEHAKKLLGENSGKFQERRQEVYGRDEDLYREIVMEQLQFQEMLVLTSTVDVCTKFGITPDIFDMSCARHVSDPSIRHSLEEMAVESLQIQDELPPALTKEELKRVLIYSCGFINRYIDEHPDMSPVDVIVLKMRESDEVMKQFGYTEGHISMALNQYNLETDQYWEDVRQLLGEVTQKLFKFQGGYSSMNGMPFMQ